MKLRDRLDKISELQNAPLNLPWDVRRILPNISICGSQIALCKDGDIVTAEEAKCALLILVNELSGVKSEKIPDEQLEKLKKVTDELKKVTSDSWPPACLAAKAASSLDRSVTEEFTRTDYWPVSKNEKKKKKKD